MDIVERNFFRLLRAGAFRRQESVEPMSAWKWHRAYRLALLHDVVAQTFRGVETMQGQFFMQLPSDLRLMWEQGATMVAPAAADGHPRRMANPLIARRLEKLEEQAADTPTLRLLKTIVDVALCLLSADRWVVHLVRLGQLVESEMDGVDQGLLADWVRQLGLQRMAVLEGVLLAELLGVDSERWPLGGEGDAQRRAKMVDDVVRHISDTHRQWQFSTVQSGDEGKVQHTIFVHNSNSSAMFWQARHSARYLRYYPQESAATFFTSLAQSLTNIEE